ncbi:carbohydrate ABC transporter membrane protein 1, CUT1 family [Pedococcus cremeus]|uniref:Carbohydrate ABC transporter membrane protein 1, CUT1 family n=1 Tax=Pedococcus cremeus TaxID=587636 RepID=A0A1H9RFP0_9MICO|nr:sugar ABC transporter permease [Pedococcus cremeus]SER70793.1 carbohydrate ABC transporter membrane protein 1, CUT1 family [Pedococcus cremeus]
MPDQQSSVVAAGSPAATTAGGADGAGTPSRGSGVRTRGRGGARGDRASLGSALLWLGPALLLIAGVVVYPAIELVRASMSKFSITGLRLGDAGWTNYTNVLDHPLLPTVLVNTIVWVVAVVALTIVISLGVAQFLTKDFRGRKLVRWAIIVPWAASLVITAKTFVMIYDFYYGTANLLLSKFGLGPVDFLGSDTWIMPSMILVGVFVSIPFTAYVFVAGLGAIPRDVYEAARVDGASPFQVWWRITLPLLRPALLVAAVLNIIYVFNSFPIIYTLNDRNPGFSHDTTITFMYKLAFKSAEKDVGMSAAAGVFNVLLILVVVMVYLRFTRWREETA